MVDQMTNRKFTIRMEEAIRNVNLEVIEPMLPSVTIQSMLPIAVMVAKLHGRYLAEAFELRKSVENGFPSDDEIKKLQSYRVAYEEALAVTQALEHAVERGYLEIDEGSN